MLKYEKLVSCPKCYGTGRINNIVPCFDGTRYVKNNHTYPCSYCDGYGIVKETLIHEKINPDVPAIRKEDIDEANR